MRPTTRFSKRRVPRSGLMYLVSVLLLLAGAGCGGTHRSASLIGTSLHDQAAPSFSLRDQNGTWVSLRRLRGHVLALTFLYTHCRTQCPVIASALQSVTRRLGAQNTGFDVVAISTDPQHDTTTSAVAFLREFGLASRYWHFLLGDPYHLALIWSRYHVYAGLAGQGGQLQHTAGMYLIDQHGRERVYLDASSPTDDIVTDVRDLFDEK